MYIPVFLFTGTVVLIFQTANGQGGPCPGAPPRCYPTGNVAAGTTCITSANNGSGTNWYQMEDRCKQNNGRLVWLRDDMDIDHVLHTTAHREYGALLALGLLSSTRDNVGLFWRNPSDLSSFECGCTDTTPCLSNSTAETCAATGCCWRNGQCQYPRNQSLPTFNVNKTQLKMTDSTVRQCVGFQLNANSSTHGQWVSYDCFKSGRSVVFVCEYKCNAAAWPKTHVTDFMHGDTTTQAPSSTTGGTQVSSVTPDNNSISTTVGTQVSSVTPGNNASSTTGGTQTGQGGPCPGAPPRCYPTGNRAAGTTCITSANNGSGANWFQMEDRCKQNNGRLVWLRDDMDIDHVLHTTVHRQNGALLALGLLSSTRDNVGLFWRNPSDLSSFECGCTDTTPCLSNSTAETCAATGCCWRNGQCQYPRNQSLPTFNVNKTQLKMTDSTVRQCVGFQLNADSSTHGQWVSYDCFKSGSSVVFVCEYKCNAAAWPKTHVTDFMHGYTTTQAPISTTVGTQGSSVTPGNNAISTTVGPHGSSMTPDNNAISTTVGPQGSSVTPDNNSISTTVGSQGSSVKPDNNAISTTGGTQGSGVKPDNNSFLKVLLSLETGGAMTNMSFSLQQALP